MAQDTSIYLSDENAPVSEEVTAFDLAVTGEVPADLDGRYLRNGPNPVHPDPKQHWFVGDGMVHGVRLRDGKAEWYRNRWVRSGSTAAALGEDPPTGPAHDDMDGGVNTNVVGIDGRTFAIVEAGSYPIELDDELTTLCRNDFDGTLTTSYTAHPKRDPSTGDLHAMTYYWPEPAVHYVIVGPDAKVKHDVSIDVSRGPMVTTSPLPRRLR